MRTLHSLMPYVTDIHPDAFIAYLLLLQLSDFLVEELTVVVLFVQSGLVKTLCV